MTSVTVALLGDVELRVADEVVPVTRPRLRALLCSLALQAGRVVPFDVVVGQVWGERWPEHPRAGLHTLVNHLRKLIGGDSVRTEPAGYCLDIPQQAVDALRFGQLLDQLPDGPPALVRERLVEALSLWRGIDLAGHVSEHVEREVAPRLVERYLSALEQRVDIDLELGRHSELVAELQHHVAQHPLRESLWTRLMTAQFRCGRHAEALDTYETVRSHLANTLGVGPSTELRELHAEVLAADSEDVAAPTHPVVVVPRQLPPDIASFAGRGTDLAALDKLLAAQPAEGPPLLIALHGPGGAGKTTLALHWAHRVSGHFPHGQLYLDMRGYGPGEPIDPAIALDMALRSIGIPAARIPRSTEERSALWRSTLFGRRILLVIDNVRDAGQVRPLLPSAGSVVLVTSRNELSGLEIKDGARRLNLGELTVADAVTLMCDVIGADRCTSEPVAVSGLIALCGRLPLALVIAAQQAARYPDTPIADLVADLRARYGRLDLLSQPDDPTVDPRVVFSWSYQALDNDTARAFRYLGLHPTPEISLEAASVLLRTEPEQTRQLLDRLVSVHLLERHQRGWYRFHDLLHVYAVDRAVEEDPCDVRRAAIRRLLDFYLHASRQARERAFTQWPLELPPPADSFVVAPKFADIVAATAWYTRHRAILLAAIEYAAEWLFDQHGWQLAFLVRHFHETQAHVTDGLRAAEVALACAERSKQDIAYVYAAHLIGAAYGQLRQFDIGEEWQLKALAASEKIGEHAMASAAAVSVGLYLARAGDAGKAMPWLERGVELARQSQSPAPLASALLNLAAIEGMDGQPAKSLEHSHQALEIYRSVNATYYEAFVLGNMAEAAWQNGSPEQGLAYADKSMALLGIIEDQVTLPETLVVKGRILTELGRPTEARESWQRALRIFARNANPRAADVLELLV